MVTTISSSRFISNPLECPVTRTMSIIGGKWKPIILNCIGERTIRFGKLKQIIPAISNKVLSNELKELILKRLKEITGLQAGCKIIEHQPNSEPSEKDLETKWKKIKPTNNKQRLDKKRAGVFSSNITRGKEFLKRDIL